MREDWHCFNSRSCWHDKYREQQLGISHPKNDVLLPPGPCLGRELLRAVLPRDVVHQASLPGCVRWGQDVDRPCALPFGLGGLGQPAVQPRHPICAQSRARACCPESWAQRPGDPGAALGSGSRAAPPAPGQGQQLRGLRGDGGSRPFGFTSAAGRAGPLGRWRMMSQDPKSFYKVWFISSWCSVLRQLCLF